MFLGSQKYQSSSQIRLIKLRYCQNFTFSQSADVERGMSRDKQVHRSTTPPPPPPSPSQAWDLSHTCSGTREIPKIYILLSVNHEGFGWGRDRCWSSLIIFNWIENRSARKIAYIILMIYNNSLGAAASIFQLETSELYNITNITQYFSSSNCFSLSLSLPIRGVQQELWPSFWKQEVSLKLVFSG